MLDTLKAQAARFLGHALHVVDVRQLSPNVRRITFEGPGLHGSSFEPGMKIKLGVEGVLRSYTPSAVDPDKGTMDVIFHLHGPGTVALWASKATLQSTATFLGPAKSMARAPNAPWALFFGDETTLGLAHALAHDTAGSLAGAIELAEVDRPSIEALDLPLVAAIREGQPGSALLEAARATEVPDGDGVIWLSGHAGSVLALWKHFLDRGVPRAQLRVKPYWSDKGTGHRKAVAKELAQQQ